MLYLRGESSTADRSFQRAWTIASYIAEGITSDDLRESFLRSPGVAELKSHLGPDL